MSTVRIQVRRGLASEWTSANPVLAAGEMGVETNTNLFKFGNGTSTWTALAYANNSDVAIGEISQDAINNALSLGAGLTKTYNDGANTITITVDTDVISTKSFASSAANTAKTEAVSEAAADALIKANAAQAAAEDYTDAAVNSVSNSLSGYLEVGERGAASGVASLDSNSKILQSELNLENLSLNITTSGNVQADNVTVGGNLVVNGTTTTLNTQNFTVEDTLLYIGSGNESNQLDLGFVASHDDGTYNHTGLVRDASANKWKLFKGITDEPTTTVNFAQGGLDDLALNKVEGSYAEFVSLDVTGPTSLPADSITNSNLTDQAVTTSKIAPSAVTSDKIENSAVTVDKLAADSVANAKIVNSAVTTEKISNFAITSEKIANESITVGKIADSSVTTAKIVNSSVTSEKIADNAITSTRIANSTITNSHIASNAAIARSKVDGLQDALDTLTNNASTSQNAINSLEDAVDLLAPINSPTFTGTVVLPGTTSIGNLTSTELGYLDGITSSVQTQIGAAVTALSSHESDTTNIHGIADTSLLATTANVATAKSEAIAEAGTAADTKVSTAVAALTKSSVGLANVDNTADLAKPVSTAQATAIATAKSEAIADATAQVNAVIASAPAALNTLDELAAALGDDANFATTVTNGLAAKAPIAGPTFTGTVTVDANGIAFSDKTQTRAGVPSLTTIATERSSNTTLDALGTDAAVRDSLIPLAGAVNVSFEATGNAKYAIGSSISFYQASGTGANITGSGITILATPGTTLRTTSSSVTATKVAATTWLLAGDLRA
jgi:hypothetical protein